MKTKLNTTLKICLKTKFNVSLKTKSNTLLKITLKTSSKSCFETMSQLLLEGLCEKQVEEKISLNTKLNSTRKNNSRGNCNCVTIPDSLCAVFAWLFKIVSESCYGDLNCAVKRLMYCTTSLAVPTLKYFSVQFWSLLWRPSWTWNLKTR